MAFLFSFRYNFSLICDCVNMLIWAIPQHCCSRQCCFSLAHLLLWLWRRSEGRSPYGRAASHLPSTFHHKIILMCSCRKEKKRGTQGWSIMEVIPCKLIIIEPKLSSWETHCLAHEHYTHFLVQENGSSSNVYKLCLYMCACFRLTFALYKQTVLDSRSNCSQIKKGGA